MAHLLIIELPGGNDADIVQAALDRGDSFSFLTSDLALYRRQPAVFAQLERACEALEVPGFDAEQVERMVLDLHARRPIDALLCLIDIRIVAAARLARRLGLRFLNPDSAALLRDKFSVRQRLAERGIAQAPFALAQSNAELAQAVERIGLPVLIKPADGYGSQNIVALRYPEDLDPLLSPLGHLLPSCTDYGLGIMANDRLLVERFLEGRFIGCDVFSAGGRHSLLGVNEKCMFDAPSFAIRGSCFTARGPQHQVIEGYVQAVLDAVDFDWGATHIEMMLTAEGPQLVEINPRLVGARIPRMLSLTRGRSVHHDLIALHLGQALSPPAGASAMVCVSRWFVADAAGVLDQVQCPPIRDARIRCVDWLRQPGDSVRPPVENADRLGYVLACAPTQSEAEQAAEDCVAATQVRVRLH